MIEVSGVNAGYFKNVDGLNAELEVKSTAHSGIKQCLVLRKGTFLSPYLHSWAQQCLKGSCKPQTLIIKKMVNGKVRATYKIEASSVSEYSFEKTDEGFYINSWTVCGYWPS